jgi:hypothetical protein
MGRGRGARGTRAKAEPSWSRPVRAGLSRVAGRNPITRITNDRNSNRGSKSEKDEANTRLNTTSDKRNMLRHDATRMTI